MQCHYIFEKGLERERLVHPNAIGERQSSRAAISQNGSDKIMSEGVDVVDGSGLISGKRGTDPE